ncbi:unnamed protein product, partial [Closterium sp. NIES-53]
MCHAVSPCAMLCHHVPCCVTMCHAVSPCAMLCHHVPCCVTMCHAVIALTGSYHGDTLAAMHAQSPSPYTSFQQQPWYGGKGVFLDPPTVEYSQGQWLVVLPPALSSSSTTPPTTHLSFQSRAAVFDKERDSSPLAPLYHDYIQQQLQPFLLPSDSSSGVPSGGFSGAMAAALIIEP